jgi:hypothetical protein
MEQESMMDKTIICPGCGWYGHMKELFNGACPNCEYENSMEPERLLTVAELLQDDSPTFNDVNLGAFLRAYNKLKVT